MSFELPGNPVSWIHLYFLSVLHRQNNTERKYSILRRKFAQALVASGNGANTAASMTMSLLSRHRQTIPENNRPIVWVLNLKQQLTRPDTAVESYPSSGFLQSGGGVQRVFQTVGQHGAQFRVGKRNGLW